MVENISSGRKVFKFLKFVDNLKAIIDLLGKKGEKKDILVKILSIFTKVCGFFYSFLDNVVWFANMGMIRYGIKFKLIIIFKVKLFLKK